MKTSKLFLSALVGVFTILSCNSKKDSNAQEPKTMEEKADSTEVSLETASFEITGMTCAMGCAATIEKKLAQLDGVSSAKVDFETKSAVVEFDQNKKSISDIEETVETLANGSYGVENIVLGDKAEVTN